jgi:hypothetical protein
MRSAGVKFGNLKKPRPVPCQIGEGADERVISDLIADSRQDEAIACDDHFPNRWIDELLVDNKADNRGHFPRHGREACRM